jgi:hypothetical protein
LVNEDFAIDNTVVDSNLVALKQKIVEVASQQPYWGEEVPARWILLERELMRLKDAGIKVHVYKWNVKDKYSFIAYTLTAIVEGDILLRCLFHVNTITQLLILQPYQVMSLDISV